MSVYKDAQELLPFAHGCAGLFYENGLAGLSRFTQKQLDFYAARGETDYIRSRCSAGIYIEFATDAPEISFEYKSLARVRPESGIDISENGVLVESHEAAPPLETGRIVYRRRDKDGADGLSGRSIIRITLSNGTVIIPTRADFGDAILPEGKSGNRRFALFYGDSITQSAFNPNPSLSWFSYVAANLRAEYINRGIGAFIFDENSLPDEADCDPDMIFVEYGANDVDLYPDCDAALPHAEAYLAKLRRIYPDARIFVLSPDFQSRRVMKESERVMIAEYSERLLSLASKMGMTTIVGKRLLPDFESMYFCDGVHLNTTGSAVFAHGLINQLPSDIFCS